jgi:hypothetical protein
MNIAMKALLMGGVDHSGENRYAADVSIEPIRDQYGNVRTEMFAHFMPIHAIEGLGRAASPLRHRNILCHLNLGRLS